MDQNLSPQVGQWMFIPSGMIMIGFDQQNVSRTQFCQHKWKTSLRAFNLQSLNLNFKGKQLNNFDGKVGEEPVTHGHTPAYTRTQVKAISLPQAHIYSILKSFLVLKFSPCSRTNFGAHVIADHFSAIWFHQTNSEPKCCISI